MLHIFLWIPLILFVHKRRPSGLEYFTQNCSMRFFSRHIDCFKLFNSMIKSLSYALKDTNWDANNTTYKLWQGPRYAILLIFSQAVHRIKNISFSKIVFPTPGVEPGPAGWKPAILAVRPRGISILCSIYCIHVEYLKT